MCVCVRVRVRVRLRVRVRVHVRVCVCVHNLFLCIYYINYNMHILYNTMYTMLTMGYFPNKIQKL